MKKIGVTGFTYIELLIAMVVLLLAVFGIASTYTITSTYIRAGYAGVDIQGQARIISEHIARWIRPGESVQISNNGDTVTITTLTNITPLQSTISRIYYNNGNFYHDADTTDGLPAGIVATRIAKVPGQDVFSTSGDVVNVNFEMASDYRYGNVRPLPVSLKLKLRTAD